jgi:hypothetical protein
MKRVCLFKGQVVGQDRENAAGPWRVPEGCLLASTLGNPVTPPKQG